MTALVVQQSFSRRFRGDEVEISPDWKFIDMAGVPKVPRVIEPSGFRFIAKTPTLQKWYLWSLTLRYSLKTRLLPHSTVTEVVVTFLPFLLSFLFPSLFFPSTL